MSESTRRHEPQRLRNWMSWGRIIGSVVLAYLSLCQLSFSTVNMTVCEIARNPAKFKNASVFIHASVISDGIERVGFEDAQCPNSVLLLLGAETEQGRKDLKRLTDAIYQGRPGTLDKDIDVEVVGVIRAKKGDEDTTIYGMMLEELKRLSVKKH